MPAPTTHTSTLESRSSAGKLGTSKVPCQSDVVMRGHVCTRRTRFEQMSRIGIDARMAHEFGIGTYVCGLLDQFAALDTRNQYVLFGDVARLRRRFGDRFALVAAHSGKYSLRQQIELPRLIRRAGVDLFHSPHYVVPARAGVPVVVTVHDLVHLRRDLRPGVKHWLASVYARALIGAAVRKARRVITGAHV